MKIEPKGRKRSGVYLVTDATGVEWSVRRELVECGLGCRWIATPVHRDDSRCFDFPTLRDAREALSEV